MTAKRARMILAGAALAAACGAAVGMGGRGATGAEPPATAGEERAVTDGAKKPAAQMAAMNAPMSGHKVLESMCGEFDVTFTVHPQPGAEPMSFKATAAREMILGGKFLRETVASDEGPMPFTTMSHIGYNAAAKGGGRFEVVRMSSTGQCMMPERGTFDEETRTFHLSGEHETGGMTGSVRVEHRLLEDGGEWADVYLAFEGYSERFEGVSAPEYKAMTLEYSRKRAK